MEGAGIQPKEKQGEFSKALIPHPSNVNPIIRDRVTEYLEYLYGGKAYDEDSNEVWQLRNITNTLLADIILSRGSLAGITNEETDRTFPNSMMKHFSDSQLAASILLSAGYVLVNDVWKKVSNKIVAGVGRTFSSPDKYDGETANAIEAKYPGKDVDVNKIVKDSTGRIITDYDIELDNYIIQVKSGTAKGLTTQIQNTAASTGKTVIGYTPDLNPSSAVVKGVQNAGYNVFTSLEDLLNFLGR